MKGWSVRPSGELVIDSTLATRAAAVPRHHVSSHWQEYASDIRGGNGGPLIVRPSGFRLPTPNLWRHRLLAAAERWTYAPVIRRLPRFREMWGYAVSLSQQLDTAPDLLAFQSACAAAVVAEHALPDGPILFIGDGAGYTSALFARVFAQPLVLIDLPEQLLVQSALHASLGHRTTLLTPDRRASCPPVSLAFSMACFQELPPAEVGEYFSLIRARARAFYLINRAHKVLSGGEVIDWDRLPWAAGDRILVDGPCPFYTHRLSWRGTRRFDGETRHRLTAVA